MQEDHYILYSLKKDRTELDLNPAYTLDHDPDIHYCKKCLVATLEMKGKKSLMKSHGEASKSGGRLGMNRRTKNEPVPAIYVASRKNSAG